jgi:hypothetical protein
VNKSIPAGQRIEGPDIKKCCFYFSHPGKTFALGVRLGQINGAVIWPALSERAKGE